MHVDLLDDTKLQKRFVREAELAGTLTHANIVSVTDVGETFEGLHYIAMEYAEGPTLSDVIAESAPIPTPRVIQIVSQLCDGLHHAHEHGLVHRDFKPDNIIIETRDGREVPRILDFGIAIVRDDASKEHRERLTTAGITLGTPHYMAPEHVTGQAIDHRIDLFALGIVMYEMLCGAMPFDGDGVDVARANLLEETPYMAVRAPTATIDPLLEALVRKLLAKAPDARPATAKAVRELLDLIVKSRPRAAAALGVILEDVDPVTPPAIERRVPRYNSYTPPTPYLPLESRLTYSPSGQHAVVEPPDPTGPVVVAAMADTSSSRTASRNRSARVSQAPLPRPKAPKLADASSQRPRAESPKQVARRTRHIWIAIAVAALLLGALLALLVR
jgi:serine/threonine protein kinase